MKPATDNPTAAPPTRAMRPDELSPAARQAFVDTVIDALNAMRHEAEARKTVATGDKKAA